MWQVTRAHDELPAREVHVLDAQRQRLEQPEPGAVEQEGGERGRPREAREHPAHLGAREDDRQPARPLRVHERAHRAERLLEHLAVQKGERVVGLVLRAPRWLR